MALAGTSGALEPESVWMCCCPEPYAPCAVADRDATCDKALHSFLKPAEGGPDLTVCRAPIPAWRPRPRPGRALGAAG